MVYLMECLYTIKSLKINLRKNIGTVLLVVEGSSYEFRIFKYVFQNILGYRYVQRSRNQKGFKVYDEFIMRGNENSRVIVINASNSNIGLLDKDDNYLDEMYKILYEDYGIDVKNIRVYFVWDRDPDSNDYDSTKKLISTFGNSMDNGINMNGLLLLSYPAIEAFTIYNFEDKVVSLKNVKLKNYVKEKHYNIEKFSKKSLILAVANMHRILRRIGIVNYSTDNFSKTSLKVFKREEEIYGQNKYYMLLSLVSIIFIDLGIISER